MDDVELKRLRWRCRRGMLELDLVLIPFFDERYHTLSRDQQDTFVKLLEQDDPDLLAWFNRRVDMLDPELAAMVDLILDHVKRVP